MNQATFNNLYSTIRTITEAAYPEISTNWRGLNLLWKLSQKSEIPPADQVSVYSYLEVYTDPQAGYGEDTRLYRARGSIVQEVMLAKLNVAFHDGIKFMSALQDGWRKKRLTNISFYDPMIYPEGDQPKQSFLQWKLRVTYDSLETA